MSNTMIMQLAKELGITVVDAGHYGTEYMSQTVLKRMIERIFTTQEVEVIESKSAKRFFSLKSKHFRFIMYKRGIDPLGGLC